MAKNPSDCYQHVFFEVSVDPDTLNAFSNSDGISSHVFFDYNKERDELKIKLITAVKQIINTKLTKHQANILNLTLAGWVQEDIGKKLGCSQSAVHKSLHGNWTYDGGNKPICFGGSIKRLKQLCAESKKITKILRELDRLHAEGE